MNFYLNSLLLPWTALTTAFSLPQFRQRTVSFSGDGPERSLRGLRAMAAACRTDGHVVSSRQNVDGVHSSTLRARSGLLCDIPRNRIIAFIHIYGYIPMSKNSISGGRIWILPFAESIRELHALFPLGSMRPCWY